MYCYRLCESRFRALDGAGASIYGGRWNSPGRPVVYACSNRALAALELLARVRSTDAPQDLVLLTIETPDAPRAEAVPEDRLPGNWQEVPVPPVCQQLGDRWLAERRNLVLEVPSVFVPEESNLLINPEHPDFKHIRVIAARAFSFDPRLIR